MTEDYLSINEDIKGIVENEEHDESFITLKHRLYLTKKPDEADMKIMITKDADKTAIILNSPKDYNITHPYNSKKAIQEIKDILKNNGLDPQLFNSFSFKMACRNLNIRDKEKYCHKITLYKNPMYQYSLSAIEFISSEFINNKSVFEECKSRTNKQKTDKPKPEEFSFMPIVFAKHELLEYTNPWRRYHDLSVPALYRKAQINER